MYLFLRCLCKDCVNQYSKQRNATVSHYLLFELILNIRLFNNYCKFIIFVRSAVLHSQKVTLSVDLDNASLFVASPVRYHVFYNLCYEPLKESKMLEWFGSKVANIAFSFWKQFQILVSLTSRNRLPGNWNGPSIWESPTMTPTTHKIALRRPMSSPVKTTALYLKFNYLVLVSKWVQNYVFFGELSQFI